MFLLFLGYKSLRATATLFFSNFWSDIFFFRKCIPFQLYLCIKGLIFVVFWGYFFISSYLMRLLQCTENICCLSYEWKILSIFCFSSNHENQYMIHQDSDLFYDIDNSINEHSQRQTHYLSSMAVILDFLKIFDNFLTFLIFFYFW